MTYNLQAWYWSDKEGTVKMRTHTMRLQSTKKNGIPMLRCGWPGLKEVVITIIKQ